jgi:hypothetical protein
MSGVEALCFSHVVALVLGAQLAMGAGASSACPAPDNTESTELITAQQAIAAAIPVLEEQFGREHVAAHEPYRAEPEGNVWHVYGDMPNDAMGGGPEADICMTSGEAVDVYHTQ